METTSSGLVEIITDLPVERWPEFRELRLRALQTDPAAFGQSYAIAKDHPEELWQSRLRDVHDGVAWIVFAERSGSLTGMIGAFQTEDDRDRRNATVWGVFIDVGERGRGTGHALLSALLDQLAAAGMLTAKLTVNKDQIAAVSLYERHGFRIVGHETALLGDGQEHDELIMELLVPRSRSSG
jgi:ribosomal protein S18 acetylase RimI-like enzyme